MLETRKPRRVVTGMRNGIACVLEDGTPPNTHAYRGWPGHMTSVVWATDSHSRVPLDGRHEGAPPNMHVLPGPGETRLMIVRFPPDSMLAHPDFDAAGLNSELETHIPGLHERFETDSPGMHRTDSVDYDIVLEGEIWLELDNHVEVHLKQGDVVVQGGTRHAWRNKGDGVAVLAFILIGAESL